MAKRWWILALLFLVRTSMAFQFQVVGALSPAFQETFAVSIADIGFLIGIYFAPGLFLAVPGGALGRRFGDKKIVLLGLALMVLGGALMAFSTLWTGQVIGRVFAGLGGVLLNVLMTKMVTDWFAGKEISFSLAVFVNSWPVGIALALIVLPLIVQSVGLQAVLVIVTLYVLAGFLGLAFFYQTPQELAPKPVSAGDRVRGTLLACVLAAGAIWGLYNAGLAIVFSFGPDLYVAKGMGLAEAGSVTSIILWSVAIGGSLSGFLIDWTGRRYLFLVFGNMGFAFFVFVGAFTDHALLNVIAIGFFSGIGIGTMVSLPSLVLPPGARAVGMGIFLTVHYICSTIAPVIAGWAADLSGDIGITFIIASLILVASVLMLPVYHKLALIFAQRASLQES